MKDIVISEEAKSEIIAAQHKLYNLCVENGIPLVLCATIGRTATLDGSAEERLISTCIDTDKDVFDPVICAATYVVDIKRLSPDELGIMKSLCNAIIHESGSVSDCARQNDGTTEDNQSTH